MADDNHTPDVKERNTPPRLIALTDGVFAIIMTILILDLKIPNVLDRAKLLAALPAASYQLFLWQAEPRSKSR